MTIELLDTEEAQAEDPVEVQVSLPLSALSCAVLFLQPPFYTHTTHHSGTVLVSLPPACLSVPLSCCL